MPLRIRARVGPKNRVLVGGTDLQRERALFWDILAHVRNCCIAVDVVNILYVNRMPFIMLPP